MGSKIYSIPGVSGRKRPTVERLTFGPGYRGKATPRNLVPYEPVKVASTAKKDAERVKDVAEAFDFVRDCPNSAKERLAEVRGAAESVPLDS